MNIFYFNIIYTCNSNCVFCYSHNTIHTGRIFNKISPKEFVEYLKLKNIQSKDRVIINGGEPFLHPNIITILKSLLRIACEVLIYTNGRCLNTHDFSFMTNNYRFVIPIHGHRTLHDSITRCKGSFDEMILGLEHLYSYKCKVDIKVILNPKMISSQLEFNNTLHAIDVLKFNNAIHITKMANTIVSRKNNIPSINNEFASKYTRLLFDHLKNRGLIIKLFDTCVKEIDIPYFKNNNKPFKVYFKDVKNDWEFKFYTPEDSCRDECPQRDYCQSAVGNYTVLEYNGQFYKGLE
ncbi:MAG: radical SAM protein [Muribaculaceae bacterium]|nr:radical SAM protein [Muribaculaceae bacterium]